MALEAMKESVQIIQSLSDYPNQEEGLTAGEMKAKFDEAAVRLQNYLNGQVVPAVNGKLSNSTLDQAVSDAVEQALMDFSPEKIGAAPAGFGLGTHGATAKISAVGEIDNIKLNGKYMLLQNIGSPLVLEGIAFNFCGLEVSMADSHYGYQTIRFLEAGAIQRQLWKDVWQPWEWVNPPMEPGKEYRTTERYDGKPVYRKAYNVGNLPNSSYADVQYDITNLGRIISFRGSTSSNVALPNISTSAASTINLITAGTYFRITTATDRSNITAVVTLEYTKTTD